MNQVATQQQAPALRERIEVIDAVPILDTSRFEHMQRVATVMARSTLMPESLYMTGKKDDKEQLPYEQIMSNCFLVVNQAVRWGLDPFAVAQCVSVVHGKLCYEGKLVSAVLQAKMGMSLHHHLTGEGEAMRVYLSDRPFSDQIIAELRPGYRRQNMRIFDGSVAEWKTTGAGTPWTPKNFPRMLIYRGTRDWCRIYEPALMLGVYTDDEMGDMEENSRYRAARDVTPAQPSVMDRLKAQSATQEPQGEREGFSRAFIADQTDEPHDSVTGEILDNQNTDTADQSPSGHVSVDDETAPVSSTEDGGEVIPPSASSPSSPIELTDADRAQFMECAAKMFDITVREDLDGPTKRGVLASAKDDWKEVIRPELHPKLASVFLSADSIITGKNTNRAGAIREVAGWLECAPAEIGGDE